MAVTTLSIGGPLDDTALASDDVALSAPVDTKQLCSIATAR